MSTGRYSHRIVAGVALTLLLGAGPALTACSDDSAEEPASTTQNTPTTTAGTTSAVPSTGEETESATSAAGEGDAATGEGGQGVPAAPVDPAAAILGAGDAPAGFTWIDASGNQIDDATLQQLSAVYDQMSFSPPACQEQFNRNRDQIGRASQGISAVFTRDADPENSAITVVLDQAPTGDPHACNNATATLAGLDMNMTMKTSDVGITVNGADNVTATRLDSTVSAQGQSQSTTSTTVTGMVNGVWFSVTGNGDVDEATLASVAQAQADRLKG